MLRGVLVGLLLQCVIADLPLAGKYAVAQATVADHGLEPLSGVTSRDHQVAYPSNSAPGDKFPLTVYAHGAAGGGIDMFAYQHRFSDIASYGNVVIAPRSCFMGCPAPKNATETVPNGCLPWVDGKQWPRFVYENTRAIDYAKNQSSAGQQWATHIDWSMGIGAAGHSMGGEAIVQLASSKAC